MPQNDPTEDITVVEYDLFWQLQFVQEAEKIKMALVGRPVVVEHVGSTAVPGLCAKPIIDILVGVEDLKDEAIFTGLAQLGYVHQSDAGESNRLFFRKGTV